MDTFPPKIRQPTDRVWQPSSSGGFYKYPKKTRTIDVASFNSIPLGPTSQMIDLNPLCPGSRSVREAQGNNVMYQRYNPIADSRLDNLRSIATANPELDRQLQSRPSLMTSFSGIVDYAKDLDDIEFESKGGLSRSTQTW